MTNHMVQQKFFTSSTSQISIKTTARYAYFGFTTLHTVNGPQT